ncbi:MAG: DUF4258 domain-containing protein [Gammaproteobacteria bacterium]|nr:MAG: DUF4258 domain-containing protein [Gammaproteobacteria bacterium]
MPFGAFGTSGIPCRLAATGDYPPSLRSPWRAAEVRQVLLEGSIIEDYPEDARGSSCLMLGFGTNERPIHVVCAAKQEYLVVITAYLPDPARWEPGFKRRKNG